MYCYTYAYSLQCIFNELRLWNDISSEHPTFVMTVAELSKVRLPQNIKQDLTDMSNMFKSLEKEAETLQNQIRINPQSAPAFMAKIKRLINEFLMLDNKVINLYSMVKQYGKEVAPFQTLLNHITHEQTFMYELFYNLNNQIR